MKSVNKIFLSLCIILMLNTDVFSQDDPPALLKTSADKALLAANKEHKLLQISANTCSLKFDPFLRTKNVKKSTLKQILSWDMKFKFRLSQNLNIIFSYN